MTQGFSIRQTSVTVTTTSTSLVTFRPERKYLAIRNSSTVKASLGFDAPAVAGVGWNLDPAGVAGGSGEGIGWESDHLPINAVNAIVAAGTTVITVLEGY